MSTTSGQMLAHYRLVEKLGEGGMGVVWRALDTRLARDVAVKLLPDTFSGHPERLARFDREARALAALNHPNIGQIYGLEQPEGDHGAPPVLVLEYVPGEGLDQRLERERLSVEDALGFALQIASGLEAAHELGIIHRDLKPGNIRLTPDERIKILDFGLAKVLATGDSNPDRSSAGVTEWPTISTDQTRVGAFLGTVGYMSPEQARGKAVDRRTDIWSFGCILYEMLAGVPPFPGETVADRIGAILHLEPAWSLLPPATPPAIRDLLRRCLEKDPKRRLRDVGDARLEVERVLSGRGEPLPGAAGPAAAGLGALPATGMGRHSRAALVVLASALASLLLWNLLGPGSFWAPQVPEQKPVRLALNVPKDLVMINGSPAPDGQTEVILAAPPLPDGRPDRTKTRVYLRALDDFELRPVAGTEGAGGLLPAPDGRHLYVFFPTDADRIKVRLMKVAIDGGTPATEIAQFERKGRDADVLPNGDLAFLVEEGRGLQIVPAGGGPWPEPVKIDSGELHASFTRINPLPDGEHAFVDALWYTPQGFHIGVVLLDLRTGGTRLLVQDGGNAQYSPTGHLLYARADMLYAVRFDLGSLSIEGTPVPLMDGLRAEDAWMPGTYFMRGRNLAYLPGGTLGRQRAIAVARPGTPASPLGDDRRSFVFPPRSSPDGRQVAAVLVNSGALYEIWVASVANPTFRRVVADPVADCFSPVFSSDGREIAYLRLAKNADDGVYVRPVTGGPPRRILSFDPSLGKALYPLSWSGDAMLLRRFEGDDTDVVLLRVPGGTGTAKPADLRPLLTGGAFQPNARFSPDGRRVAYVSDESGRLDVYVAPFLPEGRLGPATIVSSNGGYAPSWAINGASLYFSDRDDRPVGAPLNPDGTFGPARPLDLDIGRRASTREGMGFEPLADGGIVFLQKGDDEDVPSHINLVVNFADELERRVP